MKSLVRQRVGPFRIEGALTISQLQDISRSNSWQQHLYPPDYVLLDFPALIVNPEQQNSFIHGAPVTLAGDSKQPNVKTNSLFRVYNTEGNFLGMVSYDQLNHRWQPEKIFLKQRENQ